MAKLQEHKVIVNTEGMRLYLPWDETDNVFIGTKIEIGELGKSGTVQKYPLGTKVVYGERVFRYAKLGATAQTEGKLLQMPVPEANHGNRVLDARAIGATAINITPVTTNITKDQYAGGYFHVNDVDGEGQMSRVKSHPAITAAAAGLITLYDPLVKATTANSEGSLTASPFSALIIHPSPPTARVMGVPIKDIAANEFFWLLVGGPVAVLTQGTLVINEGAVASLTVDGAVAPFALVEGAPNTSAGQYVVGWVMRVHADTEYSLIYLTLEDS